MLSSSFICTRNARSNPGSPTVTGAATLYFVRARPTWNTVTMYQRMIASVARAGSDCGMCMAMCPFGVDDSL
jgi:hypothetical protein